MADYSRQRFLADKLIRQYGALASYISGPDAVDTWLPSVDTPGVVYAQTPLVQVNAGIARYFKEIFTVAFDASMPKGTLQMLLSPLIIFEPKFRDLIQWPDGSTYSVTDLDIIAPNGTPVLYYLTCAENGV